MKIIIIQTKPCYHCRHLIDLQNDEFVRIDTFETVVKKKEQAYAHTLCETQARSEYVRDDAASDYLDDQEEVEAYSDSLLYYEVLHGND